MAQSLATKYRPHDFATVVGQEMIVSILLINIIIMTFKKKIMNFNDLYH